MPQDKPLILAFDMGKASLGLCVRDDDEILALESVDIPDDHAKTDELRKRTHATRTRDCHTQRESWFMEALWLKAGLPDFREDTVWDEVVKPTLSPCYANDVKLRTREFPKGGDETNFNSPLLRIALLEGEALAPWQVWKALWSAIQKRGFHHYEWKKKPEDLFLEPDQAVEAQIAKIEQERDQFALKIQQIKDDLNRLKLDKKGLRGNNPAKAEIEDKEAELNALKVEEVENEKIWKQTNAELLKHLDKLQAFKSDFYNWTTRGVDHTNYAYPCYLKALYMGLWDFETHKIISYQQPSAKPSANGRLNFAEQKKVREVIQGTPRIYYLKELKALWHQAQRLLPELQAFEADYLLFGEAKAPYATVWQRTLKAHRGKGPNYLFRRRGDARLPIAVDEPNRFIDTQGVLGQKVPRFDNRIIAKCQLMPERNVCNAKDKLAAKVRLMLQLKNTRFTDGYGEQRELSPDEFKALIGKVYKPDELHLKGKITYTEFEKALRQALAESNPNDKGKATVQSIHHPSKDKEGIKVNIKGRAQFCRPALKVIEYVLLSGQNPPDINPMEVTYVDEKANQKLTVIDTPEKYAGKKFPPNPITIDEVRKVLGDKDWVDQLETPELYKGRLGKVWGKTNEANGFHIGDDRDQAYNEAQNLQTDEERRQAVMKLLGRSNNPIVRNRMLIFYNKLVKLEADLTAKGYNVREQGKVIIEFIRGADSGFEGKRQASDYEQAIKENEARNDILRAKLQEVGGKASDLIRLKLYEEQNGLCPYTGKKLDENNLNAYDIDHIVPYSQKITSDALWNKVLTFPDIQRVHKRNQTPYEWLHATPEWTAYSARVQAMYSQGDAKKVAKAKRKLELLTLPDARDRIESYTGLAETSTMARLVQKVVALHFAWPLQVADNERRIFVNSGMETSQIRKKYGLEDWLWSDEELKDREKLWQAYRDASTPEEGKKKFEELRKLRKKNRTNKKHHALDAFCISFSQNIRPVPKALQPEGSYNPNRWYVPNLEKFKPVLKQKLEDIFPQPFCRNKSEMALEDTLYGFNKRHCAMTVRKKLTDLLKDADEKAINKLKLVDKAIEADLKLKHQHCKTKAEWNELLENYTHPTRGNKVTSVRKIASELPTYPKPSPKGRCRVTEYQDFGNGQTQGQYKRTKQHKGQLLYKDKQGKWCVYPVYGYMSVAEAKANLAKQGITTLYQNGALFYSSALVRIKQRFEGPKGVMLEAGLYKLRTIITATASAKIESADGQEYSLPVHRLTSAGIELTTD